MFGSTALELTIGLVFIFLLVSLLVSAATELVASWLRWRAANLWKGLRGMLGQGVQEQVYSHPLIKTLLTPTTGPPVGLAWLFSLPGFRRLWPTAKGPSYIPARMFAMALLDLMEHPYQALDRLVAAIDAAAKDPAKVAQVVGIVRSLPDLAELAPSLQRAKPLVDELAEAAVTPERVRAILLRIRNEAVTLSEHPALFDRNVQGALRPLLAAAAGNDEQIRTEVETWFNDMTDRTAGWYKRKTQAVQVAMGLALAIWLDVDVVLISRALWADSTLRSAIVSQAETTARQPLPQTVSETAPPQERFEQIQGRILTLGLPIRGACVPAPPSAGTAKPLPWWCAEIAQSTKSIPVRWVGTLYVPVDPMRWLGWLLTAIAASFGAPFWFDLLKRVTTIRSTGSKPEEKPAPAPVAPPKPAGAG